MGAINLDYIKQRRKQMKVSQDALATFLGFTGKSAYNRYELGKADFKAEHLPKICEMLNCSIDDLYTEALPNNEKAVLEAVRKIVSSE